MEPIKITRSDEEQIYKLAVEEYKILNNFVSRPVYKVTFSKHMFKKIFNSHFHNNAFFYGIKEDNKIVSVLSGYIKSAPNADVGYIDNIFVTPKYIGRGYATTLRNHFFKWLKKKNIKYCQLDVLAKNPAKSLYIKWGFEIDGYQMIKEI